MSRYWLKVFDGSRLVIKMMITSREDAHYVGSLLVRGTPWVFLVEERPCPAL